MSEVITDSRNPPSYPCYPDTEIEEYQPFAPDPFSPPVGDARGRFAQGSSGNPSGRPRGIPYPKRRVPDLVARPLSAQALSDLLDRKPDLLLPLAAQILPPPVAATDPAERLGSDLSSLRAEGDILRTLAPSCQRFRTAR